MTANRYRDDSQANSRQALSQPKKEHGNEAYIFDRVHRPDHLAR
jgi:hypothetical protein